MPEHRGATADDEAPPPPPPPPPISTSFDLWEPFGRPGELRAAADAWDSMARHLDEARHRLARSVDASAAGWTGRARDAFGGHWEEMATELEGGAGGMREVADQLRTMADELEAKNDLVQSIYVMVVATAGVSVVAGLVSFGAGFVAGAAATAAHVLRAERVLAAVRAFLVASRATMAVIRAGRVGAFALRFAGFAAQGTVATAAVKHVALDQDPTDLDNWSGADVLGVAAGGLTSASLALRGAALAGTRARALASGFAADAGTSALVDTVGGNARPGQILTNAVISGTAGGVLNRGSSPGGTRRGGDSTPGPGLAAAEPPPPRRGAPGGGRELKPYNRYDPVYDAPPGYFDEDYWKRVDGLKGDPDHSFNVTRASWDEAKVAAHVEKRGDFGELSRPAGRGEGDFVDEKGQHWDIKGFDSTHPGERGNYIPSPENDAKVVKTIKDQLADGRRIILDTRYLSAANETDLRRIVAVQGWEALGLIKWYP